jgi:hypothetical protein
VYKISNFAEEKIFAIAVEIKVARYQAQKQYRLHKNIGFDKLVWKLRWRVIKRRKILATQKYRFRQNSVEIKVACYQAQQKNRRCKNIGFDKIAWKMEIKVARYQVQKNNGFAKIQVSTK